MKLLNYFFLMRPMLIIPVWTISLLGARAADWRMRGTSPFVFDHFPFSGYETVDTQILLLLFFSTFLFGGVFVFNQIYDVEVDRRNNKRFLIAEGVVSVKEAWIVYLATTLVAIAGAFRLNWQLGILFLVVALLGVQYSHPRFRVRSNSYKSFRNNLLAHGLLAFLFGWVLYANFNIEGIVKSIPYMLGVGALYLNTTLPDIAGDKTTGKKTYALEWKREKTLSVSLWLVVIALILSVLAADYSFTIAAAIALPFFIWAKSGNSIPHATLATRIAVTSLSLAAALFFPVYLVLFLFIIIVTRIYYGKKLRITYPVLTEDLK